MRSHPAKTRQTQRAPQRRPDRARLAHLWSLGREDSLCEACGDPIEIEEIEYELQFGREAAAVTVIRLHRECWESWRAQKMQPPRSRSTPLGEDNPQSWYLCTRHSDGRIFCHEEKDLLSALAALTTFLDTARRMGYRIHPSTAAPSTQTLYVARQGSAWVMFWAEGT